MPVRTLDLIFPAILALPWLAIACGNAYFASATAIRKYGRQPCSIPFVGGIYATVVLVMYPWHSPLKWGLLFLAFLLDLGSMRLIALGMVGLGFPDWIKSINRRREERVRRILEGSQASHKKTSPKDRKSTRLNSSHPSRIGMHKILLAIWAESGYYFELPTRRRGPRAGCRIAQARNPRRSIRERLLDRDLGQVGHPRMIVPPVLNP